ncbi:uncharacterized protein K460DRAFT_81716 [Cucurbitaria berberidis CBS 394.84]|uniref:RING-type domain-containing protein n=1 Tax=Cucurbitaria berberidis CBS 394.84 TaxID=1168544 RepID=A0A9P4LC66_9PLEO|nr:uncharacterized protein K460DRAFT_81716 [Cucurbitaria berberidis CBS 394.84]KAF1848854.1 hypothetical protein K460DRAFT_81716 [Cucurbitaria berberidis CBS 394.84]
MQKSTPLEWPTTTIHCLNKAFLDYSNEDLISGTRKLKQIQDIINLFVEFVFAVAKNGRTQTRSVARVKAKEFWQGLCYTLLKLKFSKRSKLKNTDLKRLMKIEVDGLWILVMRNMVFFGIPRVDTFCKTIRKWLMRCARESSVDDTGNTIRETIDRLQGPLPVFLDPPSNYEDFTRDGDHSFPELTYTLQKLNTNGVQFDDCVQGIFRFFVEIGFAALDIYTFFRPRLDDLEPCECKLAYGMDRYIKRLAFYLDDMLLFPTHVSWTVSNINLRGIFDYYFKLVLPSLYDERLALESLLGIRLYEWLIDAATHLKVDATDRIGIVIRRSHRLPEATSTKRYGFRPYDGYVPFPMAYFERKRAIQAAHLNGGFFPDVPVIPCGPHIDIRLHSSAVPPTTTNNDLEQKCTICQYALKDEACVKLDTCEHTFHKDCITRWTNTQTRMVTCPMCRANICEARTTRMGCMYCE